MLVEYQLEWCVVLQIIREMLGNFTLLTDIADQKTYCEAFD